MPNEAEQSPEPFRLVVGLGNPGIEYAFSRHNFGFLLIDELARRTDARVDLRECQSLTGRARIEGVRVLLAKPETFMNLSGVAVRELLDKYERTPGDLIVVYDELDLPMGTIRIRERGSAGTHNGLRSIVGVLQTDGFVRVRLGIGPKHPIDNAKRFVIGSWTRSELPIVQEVVTKAADCIQTMFREGVSKAMSICNAAPDGIGTGL